MIKSISNLITKKQILSAQTKFFTKLYKMESLSNSTDNEPKNKVFRKDTKIGTHNGAFHCDEVLACCLLQQLPEYANATIIRTRNPDQLKECDIVVDVGGVYDPSLHRYDHHQRSFQETMHSLKAEYPWTTKLSSAGLIYFHFGRKIISQILNYSQNSEETKVLFEKLYENLIEEVDAIDNGIAVFDGATPKYKISTNLSSSVKRLNPPWNNPKMNENTCFENARQLVNECFLDILKNLNEVWMPAREIVLEAIKQRHTVHSSGEIIEFKNGCCPWKEHLFQIEDELEVDPKIKFALYSDSNGNWRVQCVPVSSNSFENRLSLKNEWCGVRDDILSEICGIPGSIFVHSNGFIGGNKTRDGALAMALKTLNYSD